MPAHLSDSEKLDPVDAGLWKAQANQLKSAFFNDLDVKQHAFYAAPVGRLVIPCGSDIPAEFTNKAVYDCADGMPLLSSGILGVCVESDSQRTQRYIASVRLNRNPDRGAVMRLEQAQTRLEKLIATKTQVEERAQEAYLSDEDEGSMAFKQWVPQNYPQLHSLYSEFQAASSTLASFSSQVEGPGADLLNKHMANVQKALDVATQYEKLNMPTSTLPTDLRTTASFAENAAKFYRPAYSISSTFAEQVQKWTKQAESPDHVGPSIAYDLNAINSSKWPDVGINDGSHGASNEWSLFVARAPQRSGGHKVTISAAQAGDQLAVKINATGIAGFEVRPGPWAVERLEATYPHVESKTYKSFEAVGRVSHLLIGYNVQIRIAVSQRTRDQMLDMTRKVADVGGSVSFLGFQVPAAGVRLDHTFPDQDKSVVVVPGLDHQHPVLLGVKVAKVEEVKVRKG
ncbi:hypothetical protein BST61_g2773 [Cercospora zeina]